MNRAGNITLAILGILVALVILLGGACFGFFGFVMLRGAPIGITGVAGLDVVIWLLIAAALIGAGVLSLRRSLRRLRAPTAPESAPPPPSTPPPERGEP